MKDWRADSRVAKFWTPKENGRVACTLCPRECSLKTKQKGFCQVRGNVDGKMHTYNYGKSVAATEEVIETEAVNHYMPGARILSLGNVGCMFACDFCQNWQTSQVKHLDPSVVQFYTPEQIVDMAVENGIKVLSWTYNDPVVWHEFVYDTAKLGRERGLTNLYKSAFYINEGPVKELLDVIDIFSLSLKSMNPDFYRKIAKGELQPMLDATKQVYDSGKHLEISQLLITDRNEGEEDIRKTVEWMLKELDADVPLHFVGFHPAYKYLNVERTSKERLLRAREIALEMGIKNVYIGNVYEDGMADTKCNSCDHTQVTRFGLTTEVVGLTEDSKCTNCGTASSIKFPHVGTEDRVQIEKNWNTVSDRTYNWDEEVKSLHLVLPNDFEDTINIQVKHLGTDIHREYKIGAGGLTRIIVSRATAEESGIEVTWDKDAKLSFMPVLDRAHFPTSETVSEVR
jgi:pyruvate formate lyase activating enzyme